MKKVLTLLIGILLCATGVSAQMMIDGKVKNKGNLKVKKDLAINAAHNGTDDAGNTKLTGVLDNSAVDGKQLAVAGTLELHSVSWHLAHANNAKGADGILFSKPNEHAVATAVAKAKVVKHFKVAGYYLISLPFDVPAGGITNSRNALYLAWGANSGGKSAYWLQYYDSEKRAQYGLLGELTPGKDDYTEQTSTGWEGFAGTVSPELKAGQLYQIYINQSGVYTFNAKTDGKHLDGLFGTVENDVLINHHRKSQTLSYPTTDYHPAQPARRNYNYGWHGIGTMQTAPFHLNKSKLESYVLDQNGKNILGLYVYQYLDKGGKWVAINMSGTDNVENVSVAPYAGMMIQIANSTNIYFHSDGRQLQEDGGHFRSDASESVPHLRLSLYNAETPDNVNADIVRVIVKPEFDNGFQPGEDGLKFFGGSDPEFGLMIPNADKTVAVTNDYRAVWTDKEEIPISLWVKEDGDYTIELAKIAGFNKPVYLVDKATETITELTPDAVYNFHASASALPVEDRLALRTGGTTGLPASVFNKILVYAADNQVHIKNATAGDKVSIFNISGQLVETWRATSPDTSVALPAKGVYVVKITGSESVVAKIINK